MQRVKKLFCVFYILMLVALALAQNPGDARFPTNLPTLDTLFRAANRANSTLNGSITPSSTSIVLASSDLFPASGAITIDNEIIYYTSNSTSTETLSGLTRGADGTTAASHSNGASVRQLIIARMHNVLADEIIALATKIGTGSSTPTSNTVLRGTATGTSGWGQVQTNYVADDAITFAKFQNITDARLLGRSAGSTGDMQEITISSPLSLSGGALGYQNVTDNRLLGRSAGSAGAPQEISIGTGLSLSSGTLSTTGGATITLVRKSADESLTGDTTLQNDDALTFSVGANETWVFEITLFVSGSTTGDIKLTITAPAGATYRWGALGLDAAATTSTASVRLASRTDTTSEAFGCAGTSTILPMNVSGSIANGGTAGSITLQWAQSTSDGTNATTVRSGSFLVANKL